MYEILYFDLQIYHCSTLIFIRIFLRVVRKSYFLRHLFSRFSEAKELFIRGCWVAEMVICFNCVQINMRWVIRVPTTVMDTTVSSNDRDLPVKCREYQESSTYDI